jgi:mono/diheme cytochrome c family protein
MTGREQRETFLRLCASCHGREGRGDGPIADELRIAPMDLGLLAVRHGGAFPRDRVRDALTGVRRVRAHGPPDMPVWAERLSTSESPAAVAVAFDRARLVTGLVDHVESLQRAD